MSGYDDAAFQADLEHELNNTADGALEPYTCPLCGDVSTYEEQPYCEKCDSYHCPSCECEADDEG